MLESRLNEAHCYGTNPIKIHPQSELQPESLLLPSDAVKVVADCEWELETDFYMWIDRFIANQIAVLFLDGHFC